MTGAGSPKRWRGSSTDPSLPRILDESAISRRSHRSSPASGKNAELGGSIFVARSGFGAPIPIRVSDRRERNGRPGRREARRRGIGPHPIASGTTTLVLFLTRDAAAFKGPLRPINPSPGHELYSVASLPAGGETPHAEPAENPQPDSRSRGNR